MRLASRHLLGIETLTAQEIGLILNTADSFAEISQREIKKVPTLRGKTVVNLFMEPSTRTRTSFELAEKRLSADSLNFTASGSSLSKGETLEIIPGIVEHDLTGGALWYDCVVKNTERLTFSFLLSAVEHGACASNYVRAEKYLVSNNAIQGVQVTDLGSSTALEIHAQLVVDATGPWVNRLGDNLPDVDMNIPRTGWAKAWNLVINRRIFGDYAVGLASGQPQADADAVMLPSSLPWVRFQQARSGCWKQNRLRRSPRLRVSIRR